MEPTQTFGRWGYDSFLDVRLFVGQLSSAAEINVLSGTNALAVLAENGNWEIIQFSKAELIADKTWRLSKFLRGQAGTEVEAGAGATAGNDVVLLNAAVVTMVLNSGDIGVDLNWQVGPVGSELGGPEFTSETFSAGYRGFQPFKPVHLTVLQGDDGSLSIGWIRRDRLSSDDWGPVEVPMSEEAESYFISLSDDAGQVLELASDQPSITVSADQLTSTFGQQTQNISVSASQVSSTFGSGPAAKKQP